MTNLDYVGSVNDEVLEELIDELLEDYVEAYDEYGYKYTISIK